MDHPPPLPAPAPLLLRALFKRARAVRPAGGELLRATHLAAPLDRRRLARYTQLLGFPADALPLTFHYLLAQRAQLAAMLDSDVPFRIAGMIHVANEMTGHTALDPAAPLLLHTSAHVAPQPNGAIHVLFQTFGRQGGRDVFSCASDYLAVRGQRGARPATAPVAQLAPIAHWTLDGAAGRRYAAVSGDWNPIHLGRWPARMMGMRAPIIHGMHTVAKCCAALESATGRRVESISARFTAPVALPGEVALSADLDAGQYTASGGGRDAVSGSFRLAFADAAAG